MMIGVVSFHASDGATRVYVRSFLFFSGSLDSSTCLESFMVYVNICIYTHKTGSFRAIRTALMGLLPTDEIKAKTHTRKKRREVTCGDYEDKTVLYLTNPKLIHMYNHEYILFENVVAITGKISP